MYSEKRATCACQSPLSTPSRICHKKIYEKSGRTIHSIKSCSYIMSKQLPLMQLAMAFLKAFGVRRYFSPMLRKIYFSMHLIKINYSRFRNFQISPTCGASVFFCGRSIHLDECHTPES